MPPWHRSKTPWHKSNLTHIICLFIPETVVGNLSANYPHKESLIGESFGRREKWLKWRRAPALTTEGTQTRPVGCLPALTSAPLECSFPGSACLRSNLHHHGRTTASLTLGVLPSGVLPHWIKHDLTEYATQNGDRHGLVRVCLT